MVKEPSLEEVWKEWKDSGDPRLIEVADDFAPELSIEYELNSAILNGDTDKVLAIKDSMMGHVAPKGGFYTGHASGVLKEIKKYGS